MKVVITREAETDVQLAVAYYDSESPRLGDRFSQAYLHGIDRVSDFPYVHPKGPYRTRQCKLWRFPYKLIYRIRDGEAVVVAVAHVSRKPGFWRERLS